MLEVPYAHLMTSKCLDNDVLASLETNIENKLSPKQLSQFELETLLSIHPKGHYNIGASHK